MSGKGLRLKTELEIHAVSCPGVFFQCKAPVHLSICFLGFHVNTKPFPPSFPFLFHDRFLFEKTFGTCSTLEHLQGALQAETVYIELLQDQGPHPNLVLASFETSALELLFPFPQVLVKNYVKVRGQNCPGVDIDLLMEPTRDFPGIIAPKIEASTSTRIEETRHPELDQANDNACVLPSSPPPLHKHPHLHPGTDLENKDCDLRKRDPFVWRKIDEDLIHRTPKIHTMYNSRPKSAGDGIGRSFDGEENQFERGRPKTRHGRPNKRSHSFTGTFRGTSCNHSGEQSRHPSPEHNQEHHPCTPKHHPNHDIDNGHCNPSFHGPGSGHPPSNPGPPDGYPQSNHGPSRPLTPTQHETLNCVPIEHPCGTPVHTEPGSPGCTPKHVRSRSSHSPPCRDTDIEQHHPPYHNKFSRHHQPQQQQQHRVDRNHHHSHQSQDIHIEANFGKIPPNICKEVFNGTGRTGEQGCHISKECHTQLKSHLNVPQNNFCYDCHKIHQHSFCYSNTCCHRCRHSCNGSCHCHSICSVEHHNRHDCHSLHQHCHDYICSQHCENKTCTHCYDPECCNSFHGVCSGVCNCHKEEEIYMCSGICGGMCGSLSGRFTGTISWQQANPETGRHQCTNVCGSAYKAHHGHNSHDGHTGDWNHSCSRPYHC